MQEDLTFKLCQYMDKHFVLHILDHVAKNEYTHPITNEPTKYPSDQIVAAKINLLSKTKMIEEERYLTENLYASDDKNSTLKTQKLENISKRKQVIISDLDRMDEECSRLVDFLSEPDAMKNLIDSKTFNIDFLKENYELTNDDVNKLFQWCRLRFDSGLYEKTEVLLGYFQLLSDDPLKSYQAMWGKLSSQILQGKWDLALAEVRGIREQIELMARSSLAAVTAAAEAKAAGEEIEEKKTAVADEEKTSPDDESSVAKAQPTEQSSKAVQSGKAAHLPEKAAELMRERVWLMHWSLFVFFNKMEALDVMVELFMSESFLNAIQSLAPHLLRYLTAAVIISEKDRNSKMKYLTQVSHYIAEEEYTYSDSLTEFVRLLIRENDFEGASQKLGDALAMVRNDFFLWYYEEYVLEYARLVFLKKYCRLYERINVSSLAELLLMDGMTRDEIQTWIINAVRDEKIDARLDVCENVLYVKFQPNNAYQIIVDKTRALNLRTVELIQTVTDRYYRN